MHAFFQELALCFVQDLNPCGLKPIGLGLYNTPTVSLQRGKTRQITKVRPEYDAKYYDSEAPVTQGLWRMRSIPSLPSLPGPLLLREITPDKVLSRGQIEQFGI